MLLAALPGAARADHVVIRPTEFAGLIRQDCPIPDIARGPDGNLWVAEYSLHQIGRLTPGGQLAEFGIGDASDPWGLPGGIVAGPDGNLWYVTLGGAIGRMTPQGDATLFRDGITGFLNELASYSDVGAVQPPSIARGADGSLWFTELEDKIGRITPQGQVTEFAVPGALAMTTADGAPLGRFGGIAAGPDGALWFTELRGAIGRITPQGDVTEFEQGISAGAVPQSIVAGPDGALWFTELFGGRIGRITPEGRVSETAVEPGSAPQGIDVGPDGALWFAARGSRALGRITIAGAVSLYVHQSNPSWEPSAVTAGPGSTLWFARSGGVVGLLDLTRDVYGSIEGGDGTTPAAGTLPTGTRRDVLAPTARRVRLRGRRLSLILSEPATVTVRGGRFTVRRKLRKGAVALRLPARLARQAHRVGALTLAMRDAAGNRRSLLVRVARG